MNRKVDDATFVREWIRGGAQSEIAARLGLTQGRVSAKAAQLRRKGVRLPELRNVRGRNCATHTAEELNALIEASR